jgi:hypothetical protein
MYLWIGSSFVVFTSLPASPSLCKRKVKPLKARHFIATIPISMSRVHPHCRIYRQFTCLKCFYLRQITNYHPQSVFMKPRLTIPPRAEPPGDKSDTYLQPWQLLGRVVREDRIQFDERIQQGLIRSAGARASTLSFEEFNSRLDILLTLLPGLGARVVRMQPKLLVALVEDTHLIAQRLVSLKTGLLKDAPVGHICSNRPSLLLPAEYNMIPTCYANLQKYYSNEDISRMASVEPILLISDVDLVLGEIER